MMKAFFIYIRRVPVGCSLSINVIRGERRKKKVIKNVLWQKISGTDA